jgi:hypothetical protein
MDRRGTGVLIALYAGGCSQVLGLDGVEYEDRCLSACGSGANATTDSGSGSTGHSASGGERGNRGSSDTDSGWDAEAKDGENQGGSRGNPDTGRDSADGTADADALMDAGDASDGGDADCTRTPVAPMAGCPGVSAAPCDFDDFKASAGRLPTGMSGAGAFVVEGDLVFHDEQSLRAHYDRFHGEPARASFTPPSLNVAWSADQKRRLRYCIDASSFGEDYSRVRDAMYAAAAAWEQIADIRFLNVATADSRCSLPDPAILFRIVHAVDIPAGILAFDPSAPVAERQIRVGTAALSRVDHSLQAAFRHALGHVLGLDHAHFPWSTSCSSGACSDFEQQVRWSAMRHDWCSYEPTPDWHFPGQVDATAVVAAYDDSTSVVRVGAEIYARALTSREVHRYVGGGWTNVGPASRGLAATDGSLFRLTADGDRIEILGPADDRWRPIGGPAGRILRCGGFLCSIDPLNGALSRFENDGWRPLAGLARRYDSTDSELVRVTASGSSIERYDESSRSWVWIGGEAGQLYVGPVSIYATTPRIMDDLAPERIPHRFDPNTGRWPPLGGPGRHFLGIDEGFVGAVPAMDEVWMLTDPTTGNWQRIGDEFLRIEGRRELFGVKLDGTIWRFENGTWSNLGRP